MFTFSYSCPPEVLRAREDRLAQLQGFKNDDDVTSALKMTADGDGFLFSLIFVFDHDEDEENLAVNMSTRAESRSGNARKTKTASPTVCNTLFF